MNLTIDSPWNHSSERLKGGVATALLLHAALLFGIGFSLAPPGKPALSMEVTLAHSASELAPDDADFLAQSNQLGSGDQMEAAEITTDTLSEFESNNSGQQPLPQQQKMQQHTADAQLLTRETDQGQSTEQQPQQAPDSQLQPLPENADIGSLRARLDQLQQTYSKMPRVRHITASSTKTAEEAAYMRYFQERIEHIGNLNYPAEARARGIFGGVQLTVVMRKDGSVMRVDISKSSGSHVLDQAAIRSVRLASPFKAFPAELRDQDELHIIRTWNYRRDNQLTTQ